eukprot:Gb_27403 [translate_table: standard]
MVVEPFNYFLQLIDMCKMSIMGFQRRENSVWDVMLGQSRVLGTAPHINEDSCVRTSFCASAGCLWVIDLLLARNYANIWRHCRWNAREMLECQAGILALLQSEISNLHGKWSTIMCRDNFLRGKMRKSKPVNVRQRRSNNEATVFTTRIGIICNAMKLQCSKALWIFSPNGLCLIKFPSLLSPNKVTALMAGVKQSQLTIPNVADDPDGWGPPEGPAVLENQLQNVPYVPFSEGKKLGSMANWT